MSELPTLIKGTTKQIKWAETIRHKAIPSARRFCDEQQVIAAQEHSATEEKTRILHQAINHAFARLLGVNSAVWWIENRIFVNLEVTKWFTAEYETHFPQTKRTFLSLG